MSRHVDLTHIKLGDKLALPQRYRGLGELAISHRLLEVDLITPTQVGCTDAISRTGSWRFRKKDGKQVGEGYVYAEIATPELIESLERQRSNRRRDLKARSMLCDLEGKYLHNLMLTLEQKEALAMAWTAIKAMKAA